MFDKIINNPPPEMRLEVTDYDPEKDKLAIFVGTEEEIPPDEIMLKIVETLGEFKEGKSKIIIAPAIFRFVVLKGKK